jgi:hypothetical protein
MDIQEGARTMTSDATNIVIYAYQEFLGDTPGFIKQGISRHPMATRIREAEKRDKKMGRENWHYVPIAEIPIEGDWADASALEAHMLARMGYTRPPISEVEPRGCPSEWFYPDDAFNSWAYRVNELISTNPDDWPELGNGRITFRTKWVPVPRWTPEEQNLYFGWAWAPGLDYISMEVQAARKESFAVDFVRRAVTR